MSPRVPHTQTHEHFAFISIDYLGPLPVEQVFTRAIFSEHREALTDLISSNKCTKEERIPLSDIAEELVDVLAELLLEGGWELTKVEDARTKRAVPNGCTRRCYPSCRNVCTNRCYWDCEPIDPCMRNRDMICP